MFQILSLEHLSGIVWKRRELSQSVNFRYNHYAAVEHRALKRPSKEPEVFVQYCVDDFNTFTYVEVFKPSIFRTFSLLELKLTSLPKPRKAGTMDSPPSLRTSSFWNQNQHDSKNKDTTTRYYLLTSTLCKTIFRNTVNMVPYTTRINRLEQICNKP